MNEATKTVESVGLFDKLYAAGKAVLDEAKKPLVKRKISRKLQAAYDDADGKIVNAVMVIQKTRENFEDYNINVVLEQKAIITQATQLQNEIKKEYFELFATEMVIDR